MYLFVTFSTFSLESRNRKNEKRETKREIWRNCCSIMVCKIDNTYSQETRGKIGRSIFKSRVMQIVIDIFLFEYFFFYDIQNCFKFSVIKNVPNKRIHSRIFTCNSCITHFVNNCAYGTASEFWKHLNFVSRRNVTSTSLR